MMHQSGLRPPKTGRSRFSKALPSVPVPAIHDIAPLPPLPIKDVPQPLFPPRQSSQPTFRPRGDSLSQYKPVDAALPAIPVSTPSNTAAAAPPPAMTVSRKPLARKPLPPAQAPAQAPALTPAPLRPVATMKAEALARSAPPTKAGFPLPPQGPVQPHVAGGVSLLPSPSESLSSLLSAYSRSSDGSVDADADAMRSSDGTASMRESSANASPKYDVRMSGSKVDAPAPLSKMAPNGEVLKSPGLGRKPLQDRALPPPPPVSKDEPHYLPLSPAKEDTSNGNPELSASSPSRPQIWRRRSVQGSRELPDLKLDHSHGFTAATQLMASADQPQPPPKDRTVSPASQAPRSGSSKPLPDTSSAGATQSGAAADIMGSKSSKYVPYSPKIGIGLAQRSGRDSSTTPNAPRPGPADNRPPTPEYRKGDIKSPVHSTFISPVSPASSPDPVKEEASKTTKDLPPAPSNYSKISAGQSGSAPVPFGQKEAQSPALGRGLPDLKLKIPPSTREPPVAVSVSELQRPDTPSNDRGPASARDSSSTNGVARLPPRDASMRTDSLKHVSQTRFSADTDSRLVRSNSQGTLYRGRDGTLYPNMKVTQDPDPRALRFPTQDKQLIPEGSVIKAVPLGVSHFSCFHKHKTMKRLSNKNFPLTCQTCERDDREDRWACAFCHLRICESCVHALHGYQRDLRRLVDDLNIHTTLSLASPTRSGSALGTFADLMS